jgi:hypothetical protein
MFNVEWKDADNVNCAKECKDLAAAMVFAKEVDRFVTINGNGMQFVGMFGVDTILDGKCPDGVEYSWVKRRKIY